MKLSPTINLDVLHCVTPTDPSGEDEPYLWVFYIQADGATIRQNSVIPGRLSANLLMTSGPGRPGNLGVEGVGSGGNIHIPPPLGKHAAELSPLVLRFNRAGANFRFFLPGALFAVVVLIDEESVPRDAMENAHADVKSLIKHRLEDFFNGLDLQPAFDQAWAANQPNVAAVFAAALPAIGSQIANGLAAFIGDRNGGLTKEVSDAARQSAEIAVMSSWNPIVHIASALDPDEPIGSTSIQLADVNVIAGNLAQSIQRDLRQSSEGLAGAWYVLHGHIEADLSFTQADAVILSQSLAPQIIETGEHKFQEGKLCIAAGTVIHWARLAHQQRYDISVAYPFVRFQYKLDGQVLQGNTGTIQVNKDVSIPEFDESTYKFVRYRQETRKVAIHFAHIRKPEDAQIEHLILSNDPNDGSYWLTLDIEAKLNNGHMIFAGQHVISFEGQSIDLPKEFLEGIEKCLEPFTSDRFSKSRRIGPKDLWGPHGRLRRYEEIVRAIDTIATIRGLDPAASEAVKDAIATQLKILR